MKEYLTVRSAMPSEADDVLAVCRELHAENGIFEMDDDMVRQMLARAFNRQGGIIGVIGGPGNIEGLIFLVISNYWYSREPHLEELFSYTRPPFRHPSPGKHSHAQSLVEFAKRCSDEMNMPLVIGVISSIRTEAKVRLYQRHLGDPIGAFFKYGQNARETGLRGN